MVCSGARLVRSEWSGLIGLLRTGVLCLLLYVMVTFIGAVVLLSTRALVLGAVCWSDGGIAREVFLGMC